LKKKLNFLSDHFKSFALVGYTKASGILRDAIIILLLGIGGSSDSLFLAMTFLMLFQLVAYQGTVNLFGKSKSVNTFVSIVRSRKWIIASLLMGVLIVFAFSKASDFRIEEIESLYFFKLFCYLVPFSIFIGIYAAGAVLDGDKNAHVLVTSIQNTTLIITILAFYFTKSMDFLFVSWILSHLFVFIFIPTRQNSEVDGELNISKREFRAVTYSYFSPFLMFTIILSERFFYADIEGSLGLIKILESGAMALVFLLEVLFLNKAIHKIKISNDNNAMEILFESFKLAFPVGLILMTLFSLAVVLVFELGFLSFGESSSLDEYLLLFCGLYTVYFVFVMFRDYLEKLFYADGRAHYNLLTNVFVLASTLIFNFLFLGFRPISVLGISVALLLSKLIILFFLYKKDTGEHTI